MSAAKFIMLVRQARRFVGSAGGLQSTGNIPIPFPVGTRAGDLAFVFVNNNGSGGTVSTTGWTSVTPSGVGGRLYRKRLTTPDLTATANISSPYNSLFAVVFRGFSSAELGTNQGVPTNDGTTSRTWTGFSKPAAASGLTFFMFGSGSSPMTITSPAMPGGVYDPPGGNPATGQYKLRTIYNFYPSQYVDGTGITESYGSGWAQITLMAFSLL